MALGALGDVRGYLLYVNGQGAGVYVHEYWFGAHEGYCGRAGDKAVCRHYHLIPRRDAKGA